MPVRTTSKTVTFTHPFNLSGMEEMQPAGTYTVETDEELLQTSFLPAYRRISTLMRLTTRPRGMVLTQIVEVNPLELAAVLARDVQRYETIPQPTRGQGVEGAFGAGRTKELRALLHAVAATDLATAAVSPEE
jgi:hypothetical protein